MDVGNVHYIFLTNEFSFYKIHLQKDGSLSKSGGGDI